MPNWIRVKDDVTGDEYDVERSSLRRGMTPIDGYPENSGPGALARPPKPFVAKDGQPPTTTEEPATAPAGQVEARGRKNPATPAEPADTTKENR